MTYAETRRIIDVDSHVIELEDFLALVATPEELALLPSMSEQKELPVMEAGLARGRELLAKRQADPETMAKFEASVLDNRKSGWNRLGAFDPEERSHTLDLFGYERQWVLPTFAFHQIAHVDTVLFGHGGQGFTGCHAMAQAIRVSRGDPRQTLRVRGHVDQQA